MRENYENAFSLKKEHTQKKTPHNFKHQSLKKSKVMVKKNRKKYSVIFFYSPHVYQMNNNNKKKWNKSLEFNMEKVFNCPKNFIKKI